MHRWKVDFSGRFYFFLIYLIFFFLILLGFSMRTTNKYGGSLIEFFFFSFFLVSVPALFLPSYWILKKKIPMCIEINNDGILSYQYSSDEVIKADRKNVAFSIHHFDLYSVLVLYKVIIATRGHKVYKELVDLTATNIQISWTPKMLTEIASALESHGYEKRNIIDKKNFIIRIFG